MHAPPHTRALPHNGHACSTAVSGCMCRGLRQGLIRVSPGNIHRTHPIEHSCMCRLVMSAQIQSCSAKLQCRPCMQLPTSFSHLAGSASHLVPAEWSAGSLKVVAAGSKCIVLPRMHTAALSCACRALHAANKMLHHATMCGLRHMVNSAWLCMRGGRGAACLAGDIVGQSGGWRHSARHKGRAVHPLVRQLHAVGQPAGHTQAISSLRLGSLACSIDCDIQHAGDMLLPPCIQ